LEPPSSVLDDYFPGKLPVPGLPSSTLGYGPDAAIASRGCFAVCYLSLFIFNFKKIVPFRMA